MTISPALEARGVSKRYGDHAALHGVDLVARAGQVHGVLGPNGAGKTTLIRIMLGLVLRDGGTRCGPLTIERRSTWRSTDPPSR